MNKESLKKIFDTFRSLSDKLNNHSEVLHDHAEKLDTLNSKYSEEDNIFEQIHENLVKINESLSSILTLSTSKKPITDGTPVNKSMPLIDNDKQPKEKSGIAGTIAFALFAVFPVVLRWITEKKEQISDFLNPVFEFIFEGVIPFFTEKLPKFFMEDVPNYFSEKFDVVKDFASDFMGNIKKVIANIQKTVGETIVNLADKLPDFDFLKTTKESLKKFGSDMVSSADQTITEVDEEQAKTQVKREKKKRMDILLKQADGEGKRVVELNKSKGYTGYEVKPDFEKGLVSIEYKVDGTDGVSMQSQVFDANKSMETGTLVEKNSKQSNTVGGDTGGTPVKGGQSVISNGGTAASSTPSNENQVEGTAKPEISQGLSDKGNTLDANSKENENPPTKSKSSAPPVVNIPSTGQKVRMLPGQGPHDINDVPDPTPFLGDMANQLFYRSA